MLRHIPPPSRFLESFRRGLSSLHARWSTYIALHRSDGSCIPVGTMCFCCVLGGSIGRVFDCRPSLPFLGSPRGLEAHQFGASRGSSNLLSSGHHYRWAVILADLCTGEPVDGRSVVVLSGCVTQSIAAPHTPIAAPQRPHAVYCCATAPPYFIAIFCYHRITGI